MYIYSSHGTLDVDLTGEVINRDDDCNSECDGSFHLVVSVDLNEWVDFWEEPLPEQGFDILDVRTTQSDGTIIEPEWSYRRDGLVNLIEKLNDKLSYVNSKIKEGK